MEALWLLCCFKPAGLPELVQGTRLGRVGLTTIVGSTPSSGTETISLKEYRNMPIPLAAISGGLEVFKAVSGLFKRKKAAGTDTSNVDTSIVDQAIDTLGAFSKTAKQDPEALKVMQDHELELEREYTKQASAALQVMNTEAASEDPVVRRARPCLMYVGYLIMLFQLIIFPLAKIKLTDFLDKEVIYWFFWMFSSGYLGYGVLRSADKKGGMSLPGLLGGGGKK